MKAPFPYFGGKRNVVDMVWHRLGRPKHYIEPFCGSAAMLLGAPSPASLEVIGDGSGFIANFWRATKHQPAAVARHADYIVSHIDMGARHKWLMDQRDMLGNNLQDPDWPGDAKVAGWWLWGQCSWIGSGWCEWDKPCEPHISNAGMGVQAVGQIPHVGNAGRGVQAVGQIPHIGDAGMGVQAVGRIPHISDAGMGVQAVGKIPHISDAGRGVLMTSAGRAAWDALHALSERLERCRVIHGDWTRCMNNHYGGENTAVFLDPPYIAYESLYGVKQPVARDVEDWSRSHPDLRIALCGHVGDYDLPGWDAVPWDRGRLTYGSRKTTSEECIWFSPSCISPTRQVPLFGEP